MVPKEGKISRESSPKDFKHRQRVESKLSLNMEVIFHKRMENNLCHPEFLTRLQIRRLLLSMATSKQNQLLTSPRPSHYFIAQCGMELETKLINHIFPISQRTRILAAKVKCREELEIPCGRDIDFFSLRLKESLQSDKTECYT
jgi:hypothetical protein